MATVTSQKEKGESKKEEIVVDRICGTCQHYDSDDDGRGHCFLWDRQTNALGACRSWKADQKLIALQ